MNVAQSLIALAVGMAVLIFLIMKTKFHPALALVTGACVVGIVAGVQLNTIPGLITSGFGSTLSSIGLVIAFGCMMGQIMEESNAAKRMAHTFIKALGGKNEDVALGITGFLVSIPIFADSALIKFYKFEQFRIRNSKSFHPRNTNHFVRFQYLVNELIICIFNI